ERLIQARFAALAEEDRELLDVACCAGFEFDPALVAEAVGREALPALRRFAILEKEHGLICAAGRHYVFHHHQAQEALYAGLFEPLREHYHSRLAAALERREHALGRDASTVEGAIAVALSDHYFRGARPEEAHRYLPPALRYLTSSVRPGAW